MSLRLLLGGIAACFATGAFAGEITVSDASVRATAPGQDSAAVSLHITSRKNARLVAAASPAAEHVEIHLMKHENGMMMMRQVEELALPANQEVVLGSGSHLMLTGLKQPLKPGEKVKLSLTVEDAGKHREVVDVFAEVRPLAPGHDMSNMKGHGMENHGQ